MKCYSQKKLAKFTSIFNNRLSVAETDLILFTEELEFDHDEIAKNQILNFINNAKRAIKNLKIALQRIVNRTFGVCHTSGVLIPERALYLSPMTSTIIFDPVTIHN